MEQFPIWQVHTNIKLAQLHFRQINLYVLHIQDPDKNKPSVAA